MKLVIFQGAGSAADFYNRNSRWTEGLLSAAKAVGLRAQTLTDSADRAIKEKVGFDAIIVASREISASTAQLVAASRVKASRGPSLHNLEDLRYIFHIIHLFNFCLVKKLTKQLEKLLAPLKAARSRLRVRLRRSTFQK